MTIADDGDSGTGLFGNVFVDRPGVGIGAGSLHIVGDVLVDLAAEPREEPVGW